MILCSSLLGLLVSGCGDAGDAALSAAPPQRPDSYQPVIEEPDLFRLAGNQLYVQNPTTGFNIIDVTQPTKPRLLGQALGSSGAGGEMYIREASALVLLKNNSGGCQILPGFSPIGWQSSSELLIVETADKAHPAVLKRFCLPGKLITSRTVDDMLYVVQSSPSDVGSRAISIDISDPRDVKMVQQLELDAASKEIKVTPDVIFVAGQTQSSSPRTLLSMVHISPQGALTALGSIELEGAPQGRFHMDLHGNQFRIVTYDDNSRETWLYIVDISDPMNLQVMGQLSNIGKWEQLYATRFDGDMAYIVTFRQTDPLWVVSLEDPTNPQIIGELQVPGWSDFIFPRGETLLTVGRGDAGGALGISLFDISHSSSPKVLHQITLGDPDAKSEANVDHRAVTILERKGKNPVLVVPHTAVDWSTDCKLVERLQLIELQPTQLVPRGFVEQMGAIRRSMMVAPVLYSISDQEVLAVDIDNLDLPKVSTRVTVGSGAADNPQAAQYCSDWRNYNEGYGYGYDMHEGGFFMWSCNVDPGRGTALPPLTVVLGLIWLGAWAARRRTR